MANEILVKTGGVPKQIRFRDVTDFSPDATNTLIVGTPTDVQLITTGLAAGAYFNSTKGDIGALRAASYSVMSVIEWGSAPTVGGTIQYWWAPSPNSTAANGNPGGVDGVDGAYVGYGAAAADADEAVAQLTHIGDMVVTGDSGVQIAFIGVLIPQARHGCLVIKNNSDTVLFTDDVEMHTVLTPMTDEIQ